MEKLKKELEKLENGSTLIAMLDSGLESLYSEINGSKEFIKKAKKILGDNEAEYEAKAKKLAEYDKLEGKYNLLETQYLDVQNENKAVKRDSALSALCTKEGVDKEALTVLLPDEIEITDKGIKISDGKEVKELGLKDYIKNDPKLKMFSVALLKEQNKRDNSETSTQDVLSTETGETTLPKGVADQALKMVETKRKDRADRVSSRFNPVK